LIQLKKWNISGKASKSLDNVHFTRESKIMKLATSPIDLSPELIEKYKKEQLEKYKLETEQQSVKHNSDPSNTTTNTNSIPNPNTNPSSTTLPILFESMTTQNEYQDFAYVINQSPTKSN